MISRFSVKKPYTVLVGVILAVVLGIVSFTKTTTDLLPNISLPYVLIMTTYPGASPETVEMVVTQPVEASMATVSNIERIQSVSNENYSMVILEFAQSTNMDSISLEIRESLDQIKSYWDDSVGNPIIIKLNPNMLPVMIAAVGVDGMDNAQISTYVKESVMPELESIEGVASANATGLLEESVNVIIRQEKVDALNSKVYAAIDKKMEDAEKELEDGKQKLVDGKKELENGKKEIANGRKELENGEKQLEDGKKTLEDKKNETAAQLANTKQQLLTAKADLEATKMALTTNLRTAKELDAGIQNLDVILTAPTKYGELLQKLYASVSNGDAGTAQATMAEIQNLKVAYTENPLLAPVVATNEQMAGALNALKALDWTSQEGSQTVMASLGGISYATSTVLEGQKKNLSDALNSITGGMGYAAYETVANTTLATIEEQLLLVNNGLVEVEKGQLVAAVEFANASAEIALGKYQMDLAKGQLDSAYEQIKTGEDQLVDAEEKVKDGEQQLADAKESAYEKADMKEVITVDMIKGLLTAQNFSMPAGYVTEDNVSYLVRIGDKPTDIEELKKLPLLDLHMDGVPVITLEEVADVFYTDNSDAIYTNVNGNPGVMLTLQKQTGYSTGDVSDKLKTRFEKLMDENDKLTIITLMDQGIYIDLVMDSIINNILFGAGLAILILILFLKDIRPTIVIAFSIPISLVTAIVCMYFSGVTLNVISLSGLALGIGMLVDNSIVVIENIYRLRNCGYTMRDAAIQGAKEVAGAIMASTLTTICVFLPIVFTEGITRQLFVDMGLTIAYSLIASLVIALTVVPAMSSKMLTKTQEKGEGKLLTGLTNVYAKILGVALKIKPVVFILVLVLLGVSVSAAFSNGTAFMAEMDSTQLTVKIKMSNEATLKETGDVTDEVVARLLDMDDVENVGAMTATSTMAMLGGAGGSSTATTVYVVTKEDKKNSNDELARIIKEKTADLDAEISVDTSTMDMSAMGGSGISIQVRGRDLDTIYKISGEIAAIVESVPGTTDVSDGLVDADEEMRISIDKDKAVQHGLTVAQVFTQISAKLATARSATTLVAADKDYNVYVTNGSDIELTRALLQELEINATDADGAAEKILLSEIATFSTAESPKAINRIDQTRYVSVTAAIADGYNVGLVATEVNKKLENYQVPDGYKLNFSGENETINEAMGQVGLMLVLALVFMYLIMVAQFQSLLSPFIIMFTIPLAFTGGFLGLFVSGSEVSIIAMVGFVMLAGIIVNNGIVLIDYMNQLREQGMEKREAIITAGRTRLRPVLMTALTTILALSTMVIGNDMGSEMGKPMAVVTIGGLLYGTILTLVVIPCIYDCIAKKKMGPEEVVMVDMPAEEYTEE